MPGLEDLYREIILDHYRNPRNRGELAAPPAHRVEGFNPLCGDEIVVYLDVDGRRGRRHQIGGQGCSISQSSASMMSAAVKGKTVDEARALTRAFKAMMSIHESALDGDGRDGEPDAAGPRGQARRPRGAAGRGEVPGAHQVRHAVLEHARPGPRRSDGLTGPSFGLWVVRPEGRQGSPRKNGSTRSFGRPMMARSRRTSTGRCINRGCSSSRSTTAQGVV